jgi:cobalt-zinc-cadmium efflux system membrane fusion protein
MIFSILLLAGAAFGQHEGHDHDEEAVENEHGQEIAMTPSEQEEFGVELATAGAGVIVTEITLPGEIHPNDDRLAHLVPRYEGIVIEVHAREGDKVKKGQTLAVIESNQTLTRYPLKTLIDGTVIEKHITLGESASPDRAPFVVADLSTVWASLSVYQRDLGRIRPGEVVRIHADHETLVAQGEITYVTPVVEESTRTATARVVMENKEGNWRPGMFVVGRVEVSRRDVGVAVPRTALFTLHGETVVFIQDEHGFEAREVVVGETDITSAEILEGLHAGEIFVSEGGFTLKAELEKGSFGDGHNH